MRGWRSGTAPPPCLLYTRDQHETRYWKHQKNLNGTLTRDADKPRFKPHKHTEKTEGSSAGGRERATECGALQFA